MYFIFRTHLSALELVFSPTTTTSLLSREHLKCPSVVAVSWFQQRFPNKQNRWQNVSTHSLYLEHTSAIPWHFLFCWLKVLTVSGKRNTSNLSYSGASKQDVSSPWKQWELWNCCPLLLETELHYAKTMPCRDVMCSRTGYHNVVSEKLMEKMVFFHFHGIYRNIYLSYCIFKCHSENVPTLPKMFSNWILNIFQNIFLNRDEKV